MNILFSSRRDLAITACAFLFAVAGCGDDTTGGNDQGGSQPDGGAAQGGAPQGGDAQGGGAQQGGHPEGGEAQGGEAQGGEAQGGDSEGGAGEGGGTSFEDDCNAACGAYLAISQELGCEDNRFLHTCATDCIDTSEVPPNCSDLYNTLIHCLAEDLAPDECECGVGIFPNCSLVCFIEKDAYNDCAFD